MKVLVTGGAGFIGSHVSKSLLEKEHSVVIVDNFNNYYDPALKKRRVKDLLEHLNFKLYKTDISNYKALENIFKKEKIDTVCHLAAQAGVRHSLEAPFVYEKSNVLGTLNLLELSKELKVKKFVFASSSSVYGESKNKKFSETDNTDNPLSLYAATKKATEALCYSYHSLYNIPMVGLRFFTVYGPYGRPDMALFKFTENILKGKRIEVYGEGKMERDFTHIDDIVNGIIKAIEKKLSFEIFNLGYGNPLPLLRFVELVEEHTGKKAKKKLLPMQKGDVRKTSADIAKAQKLLNWTPQVSPKEGVKNFVEWYRDYYGK
jgi:UDP-glucuronate 4-epimerase